MTTVKSAGDRIRPTKELGVELLRELPVLRGRRQRGEPWGHHQAAGTAGPCPAWEGIGFIVARLMAKSNR